MDQLEKSNTWVDQTGGNKEGSNKVSWLPHPAVRQVTLGAKTLLYSDKSVMRNNNYNSRKTDLQSSFVDTNLMFKVDYVSIYAL